MHSRHGTWLAVALLTLGGSRVHAQASTAHDVAGTPGTEGIVAPHTDVRVAPLTAALRVGIDPAPVNATRDTTPSARPNRHIARQHFIHAGEGALLGAAVGAAIGYVQDQQNLSNPGCRDLCRVQLAAPFYGFIGLFLGGAIGALLPPY
jgi:hypothetical protein